MCNTTQPGCATVAQQLQHLQQEKGNDHAKTIQCTPTQDGWGARVQEGGVYVRALFLIAYCVLMTGLFLRAFTLSALIAKELTQLKKEQHYRDDK